MVYLEIAEDNEWEDFLSRKLQGGIPKRLKNRLELESKQLNLPDSISFQEKLYMLRNGLRSVPKCLKCDNPVKFHASVTKYSDYCSAKCSASSVQTQNKKRNTNVSLYGTQNAANSQKERRAKDFFEKRYQSFDIFKDKIVPLFKVDEWRGGLSTTKYDWKCVRCETEFRDRLKQDHPLCPKCDRSFTDIEKVIKKILDQNKIEYQAHNRKIIGSERMELDFYVPNLRLGIEVHGLWHHGENRFDSNYHQRKAQVCEKKGIKLIQVFSDEIKFQFPIVKHKIQNAIRCNEGKVIGARKCVVRVLGKSECKEFLKENHIQGNDISSIKYGAYYLGELVGVMTFCELRIALGHKTKQEGVWELSRFCTKKENRYVGLFSKMLQCFIRDCSPREILTYGDGRWTHPTDNVYCRAGFEYLGTSKPSYWYCKAGEKRLHRFGFRKSLLAEKYPEMRNMTEKNITKELGYIRVWDAGQHKFRLLCSSYVENRTNSDK